MLKKMTMIKYPKTKLITEKNSKKGKLPRREWCFDKIVRICNQILKDCDETLNMYNDLFTKKLGNKHWTII